MSKKQLLNKRGQWQVILHDDNKVHVDHVVDCLMDICAHNYIQSVQCAHIVHNNGKCDVKKSDFDTIKVMFEKLQSARLTVSMESE